VRDEANGGVQPAMPEIANIVKVTATRGRRDDLLAVLADLVEATVSEPGTLDYVLYADTTDEVTVWLTERYADESALQAHLANPAMTELAGALEGLIDGPSDVRRVDIVRHNRWER
jgi:quinol monooxygenase YgiN